jgi:hypothetical protein
MRRELQHIDGGRNNERQEKWLFRAFTQVACIVMIKRAKYVAECTVPGTLLLQNFVVPRAAASCNQPHCQHSHQLNSLSSQEHQFFVLDQH